MANRPPITSSGSFATFRRKKRGPNIVTILAGVLILGGVGLLVYWLTGPDRPLNTLFATDTPTPTITFTPTNTPDPTATSTVTETSTITPTATFSSPFTYTVQDGDSLFAIVEKFNLGENGIPLIYLLNPYSENPDTGTIVGINPITGIVAPGQVITLPNPGMQLPTATPIPPNLPRGTKLDYVVEAGDSLAGIASLFNSTVDDIIKENDLADPNAIQVGQVLVVPANIVTATPTFPPTSTPITPGPGTQLPTASFTPIN